jgi:hypothetical protein
MPIQNEKAPQPGTLNNGRIKKPHFVPNTETKPKRINRLLHIKKGNKEGITTARHSSSPSFADSKHCEEKVIKPINIIITINM